MQTPAKSPPISPAMASCPRTAGQFNIRSIPTLVLFKDGDVADVLVGLQSKSKLSKLLK